MSEALARSVPGPIPPDDSQAWYAPSVRSQYHVANGIVATVSENEADYSYRTREPIVSESEKEAVERAESRFDETPLSRPRTRAGAVERIENGFPDRVRAHLPELTDRSPSSRRRVGYRLLASLRSLDVLTPIALDERVQIADTTDDRIIVHTREFAPAETDVAAETPYLDRFLGERISRRSIPFAGIDVPVTIVRNHVLGADTFDGQYVVDEPDLLPGDRKIVESVRDRILESPPADVLSDELDGVLKRARTLLARRLRYRPLDRVRSVLPGFDESYGSPLVTEQAPRSRRIDALAYYVARDLVGDGTLTIPLRDPVVRSIEANRVGDRIAVVPHSDHPVGSERLPTSLTIDDLPTFVDLARSLAADGGVELSVEQPTATVSLARSAGEGSRSMHCSVSLPTQRRDGHISITADRADPPTPLSLIERETLTPGLVAAVWTVAANSGSVVFVGPVDADPVGSLEAHMPFIPATERPIALGPDADTVEIPHETGLSLDTSTVESDRWTTRRERDALHPDVAVVPGLRTPGELERLGPIIASGRPVFAAVRSASRTLFDHLIRDAGVEQPFGNGVNLVVHLPPAKADTVATGWVPNAKTDPDETEMAAENGALNWGRFADTQVEDGPPTLESAFLDRLARTPADGDHRIRQAFARRYRYLTHLLAEESTDRTSLMNFLADLRTDEPATIERLRRR